MTNPIPIAEATDLAKVTIAEDGLSAYLSWGPDVELHSITESELAALLNGSGVVFGVRSNLTQTIEAEVASQGRLLVAEGIRPVAGKDGWVEFSEKANPKTETTEKEQKVDFHSLGWIHNVLEGETVAVIHLPEPGVPGKSVTGKVVPCAVGKSAQVKLGKFAARHPEDPQKIIASTDGNLQIGSSGLVDVEPMVTIRGDVDYATGDIDFVGAVVVTGDVKAGFSVKAKKSVEIRGNVEDAKIECGGDVVIQKGFVGQGKGIVDAQGNVTVQRVLNQTVTSGKDVVIAREAICAKVRANERIVSPKGAFVGCVLEAGKEIEVLNLGIGDQGQAKARVGQRGLILERQNTNDKEIVQVQKQLSDIKEVIFKLVRAELDAGSLTRDQQSAHVKLREMQASLQKAMESRLKERENLKLQLHETVSARIVVHDTLFSNVFVEVNGVKKMIQNSLKEVVLVENGGKIEERALD